MKPPEIKSQYTVFNNDTISFSSKAFIELIKAVFDKGLTLRFKVEGFSMLPFIRCKDIVTLQPLLNFSLSVGDTAAFIHPKTDKLVIHRIVGKQENNFIIKGDNVLNIDGLIHKDNILGRVSKIERNGKNVFLGLGRERLLISWLSRINIFCLLFYVWNFIKTKKT